MTEPLRVDGVDISHHQSGQLDLAGAKRRGLKWLYHKATEGTSLRDSNYPRRREEARKAGLPFGAYHFARADKGDARAEARFFLDYAKPKPGDLRPALDLETTEGLTLGELRIWAAGFIAECVKLTGVKPLVYTPYDLGAADDGCVIWRPRYNNTNTPPVLPWDIWQFSNGVYGVPNQLAGIGKVDLNVMRKGLSLQAMLIPEPKPEPKGTRRVHVMHASMQFSDTTAQHQHDVEKLFARAHKRNVAWITGTEAGPGAKGIEDRLDKVGDEAGYRFFKPKAPTDSWIAVNRELITKGSWSQGYTPVIPGSAQLEKAGEVPNTAKRWGPKGVVFVGFEAPELGQIGVAASHYLTDARSPRSPYWEWNRKLGIAIGEWAIEAGRGKALAFYGGDQNMADSKNKEPQGDTFFGQPITSLWDELERWENTGHGNIDVIASYDRDGRVKGAYSRALDDRELFLHTDHFLVEGGFDIRVL
jgi:GH25 family lysozyme M1 (1,4-beta-N-acetylmuramidase)